MMKSSKITITTCVYSYESLINFNLEYIFDKLCIDNEILSAKYNNTNKGVVKNTNSFFNQLSIRLNIDKENVKKETNLKVFMNGNFQISGAKTKEQAKYTIETFVNKIINMNDVSPIEITIKDNILYNKIEYSAYLQDDRKGRFKEIKIYGKSGEYYEIIGRKKKDVFFIRNIKCLLFENSFFIEKNHTNYSRRVFNVNGDFIGNFIYNLKRKRKSLILSNCTYKKQDIGYKYDIFYKKDTLLGTVELQGIPENIEIIPETKNDTGVIKIKQTPSESLDTLLKIQEIHCEDIITCNMNSIFELHLKDSYIDRESLHNIITNNIPSAISYYNPTARYQGVKIKLFYDENMNPKKSIYDDFNYKFTCLVFQNGKIIISGCKSKQQILSVKKFLTENIFQEYYNEIIITEKAEKDKVILESISIFDLM